MWQVESFQSETIETTLNPIWNASFDFGNVFTPKEMANRQTRRCWSSL